MIRRFIVFCDSLTNSGERIMSLLMYDKESLLSLFDELHLSYNPPDTWDKDAESAAIDDITEWNGDGDDYWIISEIVGDKLVRIIS